MMGDTVTLVAATYTDKMFTNWTSDDIVIEDPSQQEISFIMPGKNITINANYVDIYFELDGNGYAKANAKLTGMPSGSMPVDINIPATYNGQPVKGIAANGFSNCNYIQSITLNSGDAIYNNAFENCPKLQMCTIPSSITTIGDCAFKNTGSYQYIPDFKFIISGQSGLEYIGNEAFCFCHLLSSDIISGSSIVRIGEKAFYQNQKLSNIIFPNTVKNIGPSAFEETSLNTVTFVEGFNGGFGMSAFSHSTIKSVNFPSSLKAIGGYMFTECTNLTDVTFAPNSEVTYIYDYAFYYCESLTNITIPKSVIQIGGKSFYGCNALSTITVDNVKDSISGAPWSAPNATVSWLRS